MLYFIPTPIGNLEDISLRSLRLLERISVLLCEDTRVTKRLLHLLSERFDFSPHIERFIPLHSHNERTLLERLDPALFDEEVGYMSDAGMPGISDPGCTLVQYAQEHAIAYEVLPGANAALTAYVSSGYCQTRFLFFGFLPHKGKARDEALHEALYSGYTTILYEAPHRLQKLLAQIARIDPGRELFLLKEATKLHAQSYRGSAEALMKRLHAQTIRGEWVVVLKASAISRATLTVEEILALDLPKKQTARLLSKITGKSPKECYRSLLDAEGASPLT